MQLGDFALDLDAGTLTHAEHGPVTMRPQAWALLATLARHAGQVVTKEQLLDAVWPGLVVTDGSIAQAVSDLRAVLGDDNRSLVRTVARRGYLLVAEAAAPPVLVPARLPMRPGPLFGREPELHRLVQMLAEHRLVTLLGTGGVGKTVLALAAAHAWSDTGGRSAFWVDLTSIADAALLPAALACAFELPASPGDEPMRGLTAALRLRAGLLVLDNAEHLVDAVAQVVRLLLDGAPALHVLVTSQAPLQLQGERRMRLDALTLPSPDAPLALARQAAAVAYFEDRAAALDSGFGLGDDNIAAVVRICRHLEGLPLAIRLAAGRLHLLGLSALERQLQARLEWPSTAERDVPDRQHTLRAALQWSYGLLSAPQQALFRRLGVLAGGFALEHARQVVDAPDTLRFETELDALVERSLVDVVPGDPPRFRLLETPRAWALQELDRIGQRAAALRRHATTYAEAAEAAARSYWETPDSRWLPRWSSELDNLRAALRWSQQCDPLIAVRLVAATEPLFRTLDLAHELRRTGSAIESAAEVHTIDGVDDALATQFHLAMASVEVNSASRRHAHAVRAEMYARRWGNARGLYLALAQQLTSYMAEGDAAGTVLAEMNALESPDWPPRVRCRAWLARWTINLMGRRWKQALQDAEAGFGLAVQADARLARGALGNGQLVALLSDGRIDEALNRSHSLRSHILCGLADTAILFHGTCARLHLMKGELTAARRLLGEMFELCRAVDWCRFEPFANVFFKLALAERRDEVAARLLGYAESATQRAWGLPRYAGSREAARAELASRIDPARLNELCAEGAALEPEAVCALTLAHE